MVGGLIDDFDGAPLHVFSIHAPNRGTYSKAVNDILDMIASIRTAGDVVIGGDFNLTVGERHHSEPKTTSAADLAIQHRLRDEFELINAWQAVNQNVPLPQTLRWSGDKVTPYHCDGIFVAKKWLSRLTHAEVLSGGDWDKLSDHNPVVVYFDQL